jgi:signal transduction histidine kinase
MVKDKKEIQPQVNNKDRKPAEKITNSVTGSLLSIFCHQFRSSLNVIAFSNSLLKRNILQQETSSDNTLSFSNNIQTGVEELSQLIDELIFYGKLEVKEVKSHPDLIDIDLFCYEIVSQMQAIAIDKKQNINFINNYNCPEAYLDKKLLQPVLTNLLANAIKFSPENSTINFKLSSQKQKIIFQIQDCGMGIPEKDIPRIFEPFFRGSNADEAKGRGLGLAIVKNLVEIQVGTIEVTTEIGIGTTFTITMSSGGQTVI